MVSVEARATDPNSLKSTFANLAFRNVLAAAARDYQKELLTQEKAQVSAFADQEVDLDELMDNPELEKLHADRIAAIKKEAEKRQEFNRHGHGENIWEITEADFLGELAVSMLFVTFTIREFYLGK